MYNTHLKATVKYFFRYLILLLFSSALILLSNTASFCNTSEGSKLTEDHPSDIKLGKSSAIKDNRLKEILVVIDPGHGGNDPGTSYENVCEKDINLDMALRLGPLLRDQGVNIAYTRENDTFVGLNERAEMANSLNASLFISIHNNSMPDNLKYKGTETLYSSDSNLRFDAMSDKRFAEIVQSELVTELQTSDKGIIYRPELAVLHRTSMPAVIAEIGYISNPSDRERLISGPFRQKTAGALSSAILKVLDEMGAAKNPYGRWVILEK